MEFWSALPPRFGRAQPAVDRAPENSGWLVCAWQYRLRGAGPLMYVMHRPFAPHTPAR